MLLKRRNIFILTCFFLFDVYRVYGTHIVGGELNYRHLGNSVYEIRLTVYRDCYNGVPPFDNPASIGIFDANNNLISELLMPFRGSDTIPPAINSPCFVPPTNICYEVTTYIDTVTLPPVPGGYQLAYQRCCRNQTILNIINPLNTGATYYASIPAPSVTLQNSNPKFNFWPPPFICENVQFVFDHSATDFDGDSIVYELCVPYEGATFNAPQPQPPNNPPYLNVVWQPPYNLNNLLGGIPLSINSATGLLTATPNTIGQFVVGVCAEEYKNGILLSTTRRDFQLNVVPCPTLLIAALQSPKVVCGSFQVSFQNNSIGASAYHWDFGDPSTTADTSNQVSPSYLYPDTGIYAVTLVAFSNVNPGCTDTTTGYVHLVPAYSASFDFDTTRCSNLVQFTDTFAAINDQTYQWNWLFGDGNQSNLQNPSHLYAAGGLYPVTLIATSSQGCTDTVNMTIALPFLVETNAQPQAMVQCFGECNGSAQALAVNGTPPYTYSWNDPLAQPTMDADSLCPGTYTVTVTDASGCTSSDPVTITGPPPITADTASTDAYCGGRCIGTATVLPAGGTPPYQYAWNDPALQISQTATGLCPGTYTVTVTDQHGCTYVDSVTVHYSDAHPVIQATADADTLFFGQSTTLHVTQSAGYQYAWSPAQSISSVSDPNPVTTPSDSITYYVTVTDINGCPATDSVTIFVRIPLCDEPEIFIPNAFTPNNDERNDRVFVRGGSIAELYFVIYDRWGEKVFETTDVHEGWDGTYKNKLAAPGVFVYYVEATCSNNYTFFKKGNITLIR